MNARWTKKQAAPLSGVVNKIIDIQKLGTEDKAHAFAMLDAFLQSQKAKKVFAS